MSVAEEGTDYFRRMKLEKTKGQLRSFSRLEGVEEEQATCSKPLTCSKYSTQLQKCCQPVRSEEK